jgi:hypothetical protein
MRIRSIVTIRRDECFTIEEETVELARKLAETLTQSPSPDAAAVEPEASLQP